MFKVLVWDYVGVSAQWLEQVVDMKDVKIVGTITPNEPAPKILLDTDAWDWLLIFEQGTRNFFEATIQILKLPPEKVIYALDLNSWLQHFKGAFALINPLTGNDIFLNLNFEISRQLGKYITCTVDGISYVATSADDLVMRKMYTQRVNFSKKAMEFFHTLAKRYYDVDDSAGYFLDLGANIGTTGIYFIKKLTPDLKVLAFEPDTENFKLLCVNLILNGVEAKFDVVNYGLGDKIEQKNW